MATEDDKLLHGEGPMEGGSESEPERDPSTTTTDKPNSQSRSVARVRDETEPTEATRNEPAHTLASLLSLPFSHPTSREKVGRLAVAVVL
jgi:hypothetical protein